MPVDSILGSIPFDAFSVGGAQLSTRKNPSTYNEGKLKPGHSQASNIPDYPIDRIDRERMVLSDDFMLLWRSVGRRPDL